MFIFCEKKKQTKKKKKKKKKNNKKQTIFKQCLLFFKDSQVKVCFQFQNLFNVLVQS